MPKIIKSNRNTPRNNGFSSFQQINGNVELLAEQGKEKTADNSEQFLNLGENVPNLDNFVGVPLEEVKDTANIDLFVTQFSQKDVDEFLEFLNRHPTNLYRNNLAQILGDELQDWSFYHDGQCPYEPFLWALKFTDNYIGSIQNNADPQPWLIKAAGRALADAWNPDNPDYLKVLRNVLGNWDWYQPVHVMMYLYRYLTGLNDDEIDKSIRSRWLYRALYCTTAFNCLCEKKRTAKNIEALLRFVTKETQSDVNGAEIVITNKMRDTMVTYLLNLTEDEMATAKTFYADSLYVCMKKARKCFDPILLGPVETPEDKVKQFMAEWNAPKSEDEKRRLKMKLATLFRDDAQSVVSVIALSKSDELISETLRLMERQDLTFSMQFTVSAMAERADICRPYDRFLTEKYEKTGGMFTDDISFLYGCAYCMRNHPEIMPELFRAHYLLSIGTSNGRFIFQDLRTRYSAQFAEEIEKIAQHCLKNEEDALTLIISCSKIYTKKNASVYPMEFNKVCDLLVLRVLEEGTRAARYAAVLMDLYERIVNVKNRAKYESNVHKIAMETKSPALQISRNRAKKLIKNVYRAL